MRIGRTVSPAAAGIRLEGLINAFFGGSDHRELVRRESEIKDFFGVRHVYLVSSGKAALTLILLAIRSLVAGRKVLIPAYTCFSVPSSIVKAGMKVQLCDIDIGTFDYAPGLLERSVDDETACIVGIDLFGIPSDIDRLKRIGHPRKIYILEDAAQAMGVDWEGVKLGTRADAGFFSLGRGKNITCGSGGIILTDSDEIANAVEAHYCRLESMDLKEGLANCLETAGAYLFIRPGLYWIPSGISSLKLGDTIFHKDFPMKKFSGREAAILQDWDKTLEEWNRKRRENVRYFSEKLTGKFTFQPSLPYLRLPVLVRDKAERDRIASLSKEKGLGVVRMYPTPVNEIPEIESEFGGQEFPSARSVADRLLTIPTHPYLTTADKDAICNLFH
jgi:dTDP-4-amino-4,6-dideoxygalactose transaminase